MATITAIPALNKAMPQAGMLTRPEVYGAEAEAKCYEAQTEAEARVN